MAEPSTKPPRRAIEFSTLDEVVADLNHLLANGYEKAGNWDLAQVCGHLNEWMRYPVEGYPKAPKIMWLFKVLFGRSMLKKLLKNKRFDPGTRTLKATIPQAGGDPVAAVATLKNTIEKFKNHQGEYFPSPLFGSWTREEATLLQLIHCANHLSYLIPKGG
jgi:hypothetical protein